MYFFTYYEIVLHLVVQRKKLAYTLCLKKNRTPVTFSNNSNNPGSISPKFGTKNRQLIGT